MDATATPDPDPAAPFPTVEQPRDPFVQPAAGRLTPPPPRSAGRLGWRAGIALGILAFLAGLAVMALVALRLGATFTPAKPVATVTLPVGPGGQPPVVIVPSKSVAAVPTLDLAALSTREAELAAQLATLEARTRTIDSASAQAEGLMIAFSARRALDRGLNLGFLEDQLRTRFGTTQPRAVATILQAAHNPVTLEDLRAGLDGIAPELMTGAASTGWWNSFNREIGNLVVLRKAGTPSPLPIDRVARARRLIEAGQVEAALSEVARTPGAPRADGWTAAARRYIAARAALDTIESTAILTPEAPNGVVPTMGMSAPTPETR
jgi:hypothetical protein